MPDLTHIARWPDIIRLRLRSLFLRHAVEQELDDELQYHLAQQIQQYLARGMSAEEARTKALVALGGVARRKEESRDTRGVSMLEHLARDAQFALRSLHRSPGFAAVVIITLALGIGANTAIFTVVNAVLLRPLEYSDPARLVVLQHENETTVTPGTFFDWRENTHSFKQMALAEYWTPSLTGTDKPEEIVGLHVSANMFALLGVAPVMGRTFRDDEARAGNNHVVVVSHDFWVSRLGRDPHVLNRSLLLNGEPYAVIGVMPTSFIFAPYWATKAQAWAPAALDGSRNDYDRSSFRAFARLADGVTVESARRELVAAAARLETQAGKVSLRAAVIPLQEKVIGDVRPKLLVLLAAVAFVLLIACANVAHLQLMRATAREREFGVRTALGATRTRLLQQSLVESVIIAGAGAILGLALAYGGIRALVALGPASIPRLRTVAIDWHVLTYVLGASLASALVFGVWPAVVASRGKLQNLMKDGGRGGGDGVNRRRARGMLVASEFALALILLVGAGLVVRSFSALNAVQPGFDPGNVLSMVISVKGTGSAKPAERTVFYGELLRKVAALPGVLSVGAINHLPLHGDNWRLTFSVEGAEYAPDVKRPKALFRVVRPGYFETMRIPIARGRSFLPSDEASSARLVVVSEYMAAQHWPQQDPIGRRLALDVAHPEWFTIVGVSHDVKQENWSSPSTEEMYFLSVNAGAVGGESVLNELNPSSMTLVVRSASNAAALLPAVQGALWSLDRNAPLSDVITVADAVGEQTATPRFYALLMSVFGGVALVLAAVGIYGVISYSVSRRTREIGIRLALGARRGATFQLIVAEGMKLAAIGSVAGMVLAVFVTRFLRSLLYGVTPTDPVTFAVVGVVLGVAAFAACAVPARRASRVDPAIALRSE